MKIASGFADRSGQVASITDGMMLLFRQDSGALDAILLDRGYLTALRTALAGAIAARHLAPRPVTGSGIRGWLASRPRWRQPVT